MCGLCYAVLAPLAPDGAAETAETLDDICDRQRRRCEKTMCRYIELIQQGDTAIEWLLSTAVS